MPWSVVHFSKVEDFLLKMPVSVRAKISSDIVMLREHGPFLRQPYSKNIAKNLFELRIKGKDSTRILYTFFKNKIYLVHAFRKKSQKTPNKEINTALDRIKILI